MGDFLGQVQLPDWTRINTLFNDDANTIRHNQAMASAYAPDAASLANQTTQQNLDDRATLRGYGNALASPDPTIRMGAMAGAAVLPGVGGVNTINALSEDASRTAQTRLNLLNLSNSLPQLPYGGQTNALYSLASPTVAPQGSGSGQVASGQGASADFLNRMQATENPGGNPATVNRQSYSGNFQFGTGRLTDLGMYQPAQGEDPNGNHWQGTLNIPGFGQMTHQQFLANPDAQRMAAEVHFRDLGTQIDNTPGADQFDRAGLMAVGQLGGVGGMRQFVASGGQYSPHDANGTSLRTYYAKFSQGGIPALQASFGHPQGPLPQNHPARQQVASNVGTAGMQPTMTDAGTAPMPVAGSDAGVPAGSTQSSTPQQVQDLLNGFRRDQANGVAQADDGSGVAVDPAYLANKNALVPGQGMSPQDAVAQASQELGNALRGMAPADANAAVQQRALDILSADQARRAPAGQGVAAPTSSPAPQQPQLAPAMQPVPPAAVPPLTGGSPTVPRPVFPGSSVMTTQPPADLRFPPAQGGGSDVPPNSLASPPQLAASAPVGHQAAPAPMQGTPQVPQQSASAFDPMAGLPAGAKPIVTGPAGAQLPYTQSAPKGYAWAQTQPTADNPAGGRVLYRLTPPEVSRARVTNPDGSTTILDTTGKPMFTSAPSTRDIQIKDYEADRKSADSLGDAANSAQSDQIRLQHALDLSEKIRTGANGGSRAQWASLAETYLPVELAKKFSESLIGEGGAAAAEQFDKLMVQSAGSQERGVLGARGGYQATVLFMKANPGLNMQGAANRDILNAQLIGKQADVDYAQGALAQFKQNGDAFRAGKGDYQPLANFDQQWTAQRNPQIYAAAMSAAAGHPFAEWTNRLNMKSPADLQRVVDIVRRAKPNSTIQWSGGQAQSVGSN